MSTLPFGKKNYQMMIIGVVTVIVGFTIMTMDKNLHGFGFLGITLGPIIVIAGFVVEIFAILRTPEKENK
ncbi:MAG: hypothetical protein OJF59_002703 [Cytophagales bacterium]|jgi:uncharacterized membrane protein HdeD (DUF308 family)|nr:DUF3098 domain-containing protein [Bacteroidota bacterium]MBS1981639.1 DUF3098 domain-containing protein [Bacteroidota bacterium]WHZ08949.1 MAG: hypothetical protein OJF59_002703 [Cytophagales bacterium]